MLRRVEPWDLKSADKTAVSHLRTGPGLAGLTKSPDDLDQLWHSYAVSTQLYFNLDSGRQFLTIRGGNNPASATGGPLPRISLPIEVRLKDDRVKAEILRLSFDVLLGSVLVGQGEIGPVPYITTDDQHVQASFTCPQAALPLLVDPSGKRVELTLRFSGYVRYRHDYAADDPSGRNLGEPGVWHLYPIGGGQLHDLDIAIARSDWYDQVVSSLKADDYLIARLGLPDSTQVPAWAATLKHLESARRSLTAGEAPEVFAYCRAAIDALPGAKQNIFDAMPEGKKRDAINEITKRWGEYLHSGRHVEPATGATVGEFPVDRHDAFFAYNQTALLLSQIAGLVVGT